MTLLQFLLLFIVAVTVIYFSYLLCRRTEEGFDGPGIQIKLYISSAEVVDIMKKWRKMLNPNLPVVFASSIEESDVILVINNADVSHKDYIHKHKNKTIIVRMEPNFQDVEGERDYLAVWTVKNGLNNVEWFFPTYYSEIVKPIPPSRVVYHDAVSAVVTPKYIFPGHKKRLDFLMFLEQHHPEINLHIYGASNPFKFKNYKGPLDNDDKSTALVPYKYHFNCENNFIDNYITEKFTDAILCETFLFYGGPSNVVDIYNPRSYALLDMDDFEGSAMKMIRAIKAHKWENCLQKIREVKRDILENRSLSPRIAELFK